MKKILVALFVACILGAIVAPNWLEDFVAPVYAEHTTGEIKTSKEKEIEILKELKEIKAKRRQAEKIQSLERAVEKETQRLEEMKKGGSK